MLVVEDLPTYYSISPVIEVVDINKGNTSNAKLEITVDGKYILRKLKDTKQATTEFLLSKGLSDYNISPRILLSNKNQSYIKDNAHIYNLQNYIENDKDTNKEINFYKMGKAISLFHSNTKTITGIHEQNDRFSLENMWFEIKQRVEFNNLEYKSKLVTLIEKCANYKFEKNCYIHGDLGVWNLLFNKNKIYIIDFW